MEQIIRDIYRLYFNDEITFTQLVGAINRAHFNFGQKHIFLVTPTSELQFAVNLFKSFLTKVEK